MSGRFAAAVRPVTASLFVLAALMTSLLATASASDGQMTIFKGRFVCGDRPLAEARIELLGDPRSSGGGGVWGWIAPLEDHLPGTVRQTTYATSQGDWSFTVPRTKSVNYYLRAVLDDGRGTIVTDYPSADPSYATPGSGGTNFDDVPVQDYHTQAYPNDECHLWQALKAAKQSYTQLMGKRPPYGNVVATYGAPNRGVPFAAYTTIVWPRDYPVGSGSRVRHEFWHTIRNASLGSENAFLDEVSEQDFRSTSNPCADTSPQFAFHEGWAEFWGHDFWPAPDCYGSKADAQAVAGDVAWALTRLTVNCPVATPKHMVEVMLAHGPAIHSLADFEKQLGVGGTGCEGRPVDPRTVPRVTAAPPVPGDRWVHDLRTALTSTRKREARLAALLPGADRAAVSARCPVTPCLQAVGRKLAPALIRGQLAQARAAASALQKQLSIDAQNELRGHPSQTFVDRIRTMPRGLAQRLAAIGIDSVSKALTDVQPLARRDHSAGTRSVLGVLRSQRNSLVRAQRRGAGLVVGPLGWSGWLGYEPAPRSVTVSSAPVVEVDLDRLPYGTILSQTARDGIVFGSARSLGFPGRLPRYVCEIGFEWSFFGARTYACGTTPTSHYSGTLARLTTPARSISVSVGSTYLVPGGIPVELDGFSADGAIVSQDATLVGSSAGIGGAGLVPKELKLAPPITAKPIRFIALYVNSAIQTVRLDTPPAVLRQEPRISISRLVYRPKAKP